jgi:hypothetical protein
MMGHNQRFGNVLNTDPDYGDTASLRNVSFKPIIDAVDSPRAIS